MLLDDGRAARLWPAATHSWTPTV